MKTLPRIESLAKAVLILWFIIAMYLQHNVGLADNGDFTRSMQWITSGPIGIEPNWPAAGTEDWSKRFLSYWIPYWKLEWRITRPTTSAILLWFPGALLNYSLYSPKLLYLPLLSLFPKLLLLGVLLLLFKWTRRQARYRIFFIVGLGVPITFLVTSTDYIAYFNSFYQESASFVFLFLFLTSILILKQRPFLVYLVLSLALLLFLATSKASNGYWPLVAIPFVLYVWSLSRTITSPTKLMAGLALILTFTVVAQLVSARGSVRNYPYHSLFFGVLTFSDNPSEHLRRLGLEGAMQCINSSSFSALGSECFAKYQYQMTHLNTFKVIYREPAVIFRMLKYVLDNMQTVTLDYLGKYSFDDPRTRTVPLIAYDLERGSWTPLNLWALLKLTFFPKGYALALVLIVFTGWFIFGLKQTGFYWDLAIVGLISTIACVADMIVAILGDGKHELIKHLFLSNVLFDIAAILFLNGVLVFCFELAGKKLSKSKSNSQRPKAA